MESAFYLAAAVAVISTALAITRLNAVHALLYLVVSLLAIALIFFLLGAALVAALEVIIYAGAIVVLFVFVVMMLNLGDAALAREKSWLPPGVWRGPVFLGVVVLGECAYLLWNGGEGLLPDKAVGPKEVGMALYGSYGAAVLLASMLLLAGLVGAYHLGRRSK